MSGVENECGEIMASHGALIKRNDWLIDEEDRNIDQLLVVVV